MVTKNSISLKKYFTVMLFDYRKKRAISKAQKYADTYRRKYLVIVSGKRPVVVSMQGIKQLIRTHKFVKGFDAAKAREIAIYEANPRQR